MNLNDLLVKEKTVVQPFPGCEGFEVTLAYLSKESVNSLRKKATISTINRKTRGIEEKLDEDLFSKFFVAAVIKNWSGLKFKYLDELIPVDLSGVADLEAELAYDADAAEVLMKNSSSFDRWVGEMVNDLQNFTKAS